MNRINEMGMQLLQYKGELQKDYPKIVRDSLLLALEQMVENKAMDLDTFNIIENKELNAEDFREYLLTKPTFSKTKEEIFDEFEIVRKILVEKLEENELNDLLTESIPERDIISVSKKFSIGEQFTMDYFGVDEKDLLKLMKRRGFIEKFAVLRLTTIFKDIIDKIPSYLDLFKTDMSLVYFDKDKEGYNIDLIFEIKIEHIENTEVTSDIIEKIKDIKLKAKDMYDEKTIK